jgi:hypothetical protein
MAKPPPVPRADGPNPYGVGPPPPLPPRRTRAAARATAYAAAVRRRMRRYPVWSARVVLAVAVAGVAVVAPLVLLVGHRRLLVDMEFLVGVVAMAMFLFLAVGLYKGVRVRKKEAMAGDLQFVGADWMPSNLSDIGSFDADGCGGIIGGILLALALLVLLVVGLWLFVNVALVVFFLLSLALGWVFQRALRQVFAKSRRCRGDLAASLGYAAWYTFLYTGWLFAALMLADRLGKAHAA